MTGLEMPNEFSNVNERKSDKEERRDDAAQVRELLTAFLGADADMSEVRAMLRGWMDEVRRKQLPPEQALREFKELLPLGSSFAASERERGERNAAELISLFIQEYYRESETRGESRAD